MAATTAQEILDFWLPNPAIWYKKDAELDKQIRHKFENLFQRGVKGELDGWLKQPDSAAALVILLDQFSRNMYRDTPKAFSGDEKALSCTKAIIKAGLDKEENFKDPRALEFVHMPLMHSEKLEDHKEAIRVMCDSGNPRLVPNCEYERMHKAIIDRFGRYPHRNAILGRSSTPEELEFLKTNSGF